MLSREYPNLYIDGRWQRPSSGQRHEVISPSNGEHIGYAAAGDEADADRAVEAARRAFYDSDWPARPVEERAAMMERLAALVTEHHDEFRDLLVDELGVGVMGGEGHSAMTTLLWNYHAQIARNHPFTEVREADLGPLTGEAGGIIAPFMRSKSLLVREPIGVVVSISAFNSSISGVAQKIAPAVAAGCTVIIKAPDPNPLAIMALADLVGEAGFPPGVINVVAVTREGSQRLVAHPDVDMVTFTGSVEVGKQVAATCGELIRPCVLELGGKSAAIILEDADLDAAIPVLVGSSAANGQGESCVCRSRILAPRSQYDEIAGRLAEAFSALKVGDPHEPDTVIGPMITAKHRDFVLGWIEKAVADGATVATGGGAPEGLDQGWYVEPTLLTGVTNDMAVAQEEIFGPVIALIPFDDEEDAIRIANDSRFGLSGSVFCGSTERGLRVARRIRTGTFSVNTLAADFNSSFGGYKESGIGREHGPDAIGEFLLEKTISVDPSVDLPKSALQSAPAHA